MLKTIKEIYLKHKEIINYLIFGVLTTAVSLETKYLLLFTIFEPSNAIELQVAITLSWIVAVLFAYFTNRAFVFESENKNKLKELGAFFVSRIATLFLEMFIMWFFVTLLQLNSNFYVILFTLISQILIIIGNYILSKIFVFKKAN